MLAKHENFPLYYFPFITSSGVTTVLCSLLEFSYYHISRCKGTCMCILCVCVCIHFCTYKLNHIIVEVSFSM